MPCLNCGGDRCSCAAQGLAPYEGACPKCFGRGTHDPKCIDAGTEQERARKALSLIPESSVADALTGVPLCEDHRRIRRLWSIANPGFFFEV